MRILLTGASGEIGIPLISRLGQYQHEIHVISRVERSNDHELVKWIQADIRDPESLRRACQCEPELVVHMAAVTHSTSATTYDAVNVQGTSNLINALSNVTPGRFIHLSTRAIGKLGGAYAASKERAEGVVKRSDLPWTILRPAEVYGGTGSDQILSLAADLRRRQVIPILGDGSYKLSPVLADDVVEALLYAIEFTPIPNKTYVLAGPEEFTYLEIVEVLETLQDLPHRRQVRIPITLAKVLIRGLAMLGIGRFVPDQVPRLLLEKSSDSSAAAVDLQFKPTRFEDALPLLLQRGMAPPTEN